MSFRGVTIYFLQLLLASLAPDSASVCQLKRQDTEVYIVREIKSAVLCCAVGETFQLNQGSEKKCLRCSDGQTVRH